MPGPQAFTEGQEEPSLLGSSDRLEVKHGQLTTTRGGEWWLWRREESELQSGEGGQRSRSRYLRAGDATVLPYKSSAQPFDEPRTGLAWPRICSAMESAAGHLAARIWDLLLCALCAGLPAQALPGRPDDSVLPVRGEGTRGEGSLRVRRKMIPNEPPKLLLAVLCGRDIGLCWAWTT